MPAISESAGWGPVYWWPRNNFDGSKGINRFQSFSENWRPWLLLSPRLSNAGGRRKVGYARAATFHGKSGDSLYSPGTSVFNALFLVMNDGEDSLPKSFLFAALSSPRVAIPSLNTFRNLSKRSCILASLLLVWLLVQQNCFSWW